MPDLQTEIFTKVLPNLSNIKFDDPDETLEEQHMTETTDAPPLTRQVFEFIKSNPKCKGKMVLDHFTALDYKRTVVAATVTALIKTNRAERLDGRLCLTRNDYDRLKVTKATAKPALVVQNPKQEEPKPTFDIDVLLGTLSMYQGRELYNRLKSIYGG